MKKEDRTKPGEDWLAMPFRDWTAKVGISPSHGYDLVKAGKLKLLKAGKRSLVTKAESDRFLATGA